MKISTIMKYCNVLTVTFLRECYAALVIAHGYILVGCTIGFPGILIPQLQNANYNLSNSQMSWLGSTSCLTSLFATFPILYLSIKFGRKQNLQICYASNLIGWCIVLFSQNIKLIILSFVFTGIGQSIVLPIAITYVTEAFDAKRRGAFLSLDLLFMAIGSSLFYVLNLWFSWRILALCAAILSFSGLFQLFFIPDTKFWFLLIDDEEQAKASIKWYQPNLTSAEVDAEIRQMKICLADQKNNGSTKERLLRFLNSFKTKKYAKATIICGFLYFLRPGCGRPILISYTQNIFDQLGTPYNSKNLIFILGFVQIVGSAFTVFLIHSFKRKTIFFFMSTIMLTCLIFLIIDQFFLDMNMSYLSLIVVGVLYVYISTACTTFMSIVGIIAAEICYPQFRAETVSFSMLLLYVSSSILLYTYPSIAATVPHQYILMYFWVDVLIMMVIVYAFIPETKGKKFYETEEISVAAAIKNLESRCSFSLSIK